MQTKYYRQLRNTNIIVFLMSTLAMLGHIFTTQNLDEVFLFTINNPFISVLRDHSGYMVLCQIFAINIASLILALAFARRPNAAAFPLLKYIPFILVLVQIILELIIAFSIFWWVSRDHPQSPTESFIYWVTWLSSFTLIEFVLSNCVIAFTLYKSDLGFKVLRISFWILAVAVLGIVFNLIDTLFEGLYTFILSEQVLAGFGGWTGRALFPPGNQHFWLFTGMLFVCLFSLVGIWVYLRAMIVDFKKLN